MTSTTNGRLNWAAVFCFRRGKITQSLPVRQGDAQNKEQDP